MTIVGAGSTDPGGGIARYEHRTSPDGSAWSAAAAGGSLDVTAPGQTFVQMRAVDTAGNASAWAPAVTGAANTAMIDSTGPTAPTLSGALAGWQHTASETVTAAGSIDAGSGVAGYQYRTSTDAGSTWSAVQSGALLAVSAEGRTDLQFRAVDAVGNHSAWAQATVRLDNVAPTAPAVSGGAAAWRNVASVLTAASGSADTGGSGVAGYEYETSTDGGLIWSAPAAGQLARRERRGRDARPVRGRRRRRPRVGMDAGDRPARPHRASRRRRSRAARSSWQNVGARERHRGRVDRHRRLGPRPLPLRDVDGRRIDLDGSGDRGAGRRHGSG